MRNSSYQPRHLKEAQADLDIYARNLEKLLEVSKEFQRKKKKGWWKRILGRFSRK